MKSESESTNELCAELVKLGAMFYPIMGGMRRPPGWPDRYIHHRLWAGFIEFKNPDTPTDTAQRLVIENLNKIRPCSAYIVRHGVNRIEDARNRLITSFDTPQSLLNTLQLLAYTDKRMRDGLS